MLCWTLRVIFLTDFYKICCTFLCYVINYQLHVSFAFTPFHFKGHLRSWMCLVSGFTYTLIFIQRVCIVLGQACQILWHTPISFKATASSRNLSKRLEPVTWYCDVVTLQHRRIKIYHQLFLFSAIERHWIKNLSLYLTF